MKDESKYDSSADSLVRIMQRLRSPEGCPWDRKQTHESLKQYLSEECAELLDAVDDGDPKAICEELGDVLMNVVFHCVIAEENEHFDFEDVLETIIDKMIRRHPHVFGDASVDSADEVKLVWDEIKKTEGKPEPDSVLDCVPRNLSALLTARTVQKKAAKYGFDWEDTGQIIAKIEEELQELKVAMAAGREEEVDEEIGDLLFSVVNLSRYRKRRNAEDLLNETVRKFRERFAYIEEQLKLKNMSLEAASLDEMDKLWEEAKSKNVC
ncbi:nucleoside triphosphate pyrophosphohydrolase [Lentisphaerota bacterium ZTH]|nr:nucleoside triphosphate pyrophosphohydrolase [Lentisphaerota bacterium]WET07280.1 nucleoside triphosphate pyrophosphohydrolase [Lentisphaerota bacterium ZTH]